MSVTIRVRTAISPEERRQAANQDSLYDLLIHKATQERWLLVGIVKPDPWSLADHIIHPMTCNAEPAEASKCGWTTVDPVQPPYRWVSFFDPTKPAEASAYHRSRPLGSKSRRCQTYAPTPDN